MEVNLEVLPVQNMVLFPVYDQTVQHNSNTRPGKVNSRQPYQLLRAPASNDLPSSLHK